MNGRFWAIATVITGAISLGITIAFAMLPEVTAAGECFQRGAVVQFEFARHIADLLSIFGEPESTCRPLVVTAMDAVNHLDTLAFIPAYTLFCVCAALFLANGVWQRPLVIIAIGAALLAAVGDYLETTTLLALTQTLDAPADLLQYSQLGAWSKFALLAAHAVFCAGICYTSDRPRYILGAVLMLPPFGVAAAAYDHVAFSNIMAAGFTVAWVALLVMAIVSVVRAKGAQA
ncbi:MAG: hypothetical protein NT015_03530 [Alphaproteobacteria bacterium]|nr:hypothetical protein [Alphaproteobacteria bacterium]